jgi:primosomal protein N''
MDQWEFKKAFLEQQHDRMLQEAAKERLMRRATTTEVTDKGILKKEVKPMNKRRFAYLVALAILASLLIAQAVSASVSSGGGGFFLVR